MSQNLPANSLSESSADSSADLNREDEIDLSAAGRLILKHRILVGAVTLAAAIGAVIYAKVAPPQYEAMATLEARPAPPQGIDPDIFGKVISDGSVNTLTEEDIATTAAKLVRHEFLAKVAADAELQKRIFQSAKPSGAKTAKGPVLPLDVQIIKYLAQNITVSPVRKTRLIDVTAKHRDPAIAALIADTFVRVVISDGINTRAEFAGKKIEDLESDFRNVSSRMVESQRRIALYTRSVELREALTTSRNEAKALAGRYKELHPKLIEATAVVRKQEEALTAEFHNIRSNPIESPYWTESLGGADATDGLSSAQVENLLAGRYLFLASELDGMRNLHTNLNLRLNEVRIANNAPELDLRLFQSAVTPLADEKVSPNKVLILAAGLAFGLCFGSASALLLGWVRPRIDSAADWKSVSTSPLLGIINDFPTPETTPYEMVDATKGYNPLMEQFRNLRTRLICPKSGSSGAMLVTSALPQEGKTSIASALALSLVRVTPGSVVLVDLDLQRPSVHRDLRLPNDFGVSDILLGKCSIDDALIETDGLMVLTAGSSAFQALDRLGSPALAEMIAELKKRFSRVIVDSTPVLPTAGTLLLAALCDDVLLVANNRSTPTPSFKLAEQELREAGAKIRGGVLNQIPVRNHKASPQYKYLVRAYDQLSRRLLTHGTR
jgi:capsular exopolysaccharide synthesis family protein